VPPQREGLSLGQLLLIFEKVLTGVPDSTLVLLLQPTSPLRTAEDIAECLDIHADRPTGYCHQPSFRSNSDSQFSSRVLGALVSDLSRTASPPPARATCAGGGGISSPSQRATLSSTK